MFGGERQGPGILGMVARTAVISATSTAVSRRGNQRMANREYAHQQQEAAEAAGWEAQAELERTKAHLAALQAQQVQAAAPAAPASSGTDLLVQLQQLAQLKEAGALNDAEFAAAK